MSGSSTREVEVSGSTAGEIPSSAMPRSRRTVESRCAKVGAALFGAKVRRHGERREADAQARPGRLVHLPEDEGGLGDDARLGHLVEEIVALARALAPAGEDGVARVLLGDVADELLDD